MLTFLQTYGFFGGGNIGNILAQWEQLGVFSYVLPFLIIFALIFGILSKLNFFNNKAVNAVLALSVSLMSLQFGFVSIFFSDIFPFLGVGLAVILVALILLGLFMDTDQTFIMMIFGAVVLIIVLWSSFDSLGGSSFGYWLSQNMGSVILLGIIIIIFGAVLFSGQPRNSLRGDNALSTAIKALSGKP